MVRKVNLFYVKKIEDRRYFNTKTIIDPPIFYRCFRVYHRQLTGIDNTVAEFYFGPGRSNSMTRAKKGAQVFCKQMNTYYPFKANW